MSRLDRLFTLLSSSSSSGALAAKQLGEIQHAHPDQLLTLISRLHPLFRSDQWETRIAASKALVEILKASTPWNPEILKSDPEEEQEDWKWVDKFNLEKILELGCATYDDAPDDNDEEEIDIETQKMNISSTLGVPYVAGAQNQVIELTDNPMLSSMLGTKFT